MQRVLTVGVFDLFHYGHLKILEQSRSQGDYLIVGVHNDVNYSKGVEFVYSLEQRMEMVKACRYVSEVMPYIKVSELVYQVDFDIFVHGPDENHALFQQAFAWCKENGKTVVSVPRTPGISSSGLRQLSTAF